MGSEERKRAPYLIGSKFRSAQVKDPQEYLDAALGAEKFIAQYAHRTPDGLYWKKSGLTWSRIGAQEIDQSFYSGTAGILYFYLKLYEVTKDESYLETIKEASRYLSIHWRDFFGQSSIFGLPETDYGIYMGVGGIALIEAEVYRSIGDENAKRAVEEIGAYYRESANHGEDGAYWTGSTGLAMDGGILLLLTDQYRLLGDPRTLDLIREGAAWYLKQGIRKEDGGLEFNGCRNFSPVSWPNYEFGTAGAGYLLTRLYDLLGDEAYLQAAKDATLYLKSIQEPQSKGYLIPHDVYVPEGTQPVYFLSSCHGPGGNSKMYWRLYQITGDEAYFDEIRAMADGIESTGAPERSSVGFWNTQCYCCGHAGLVQFYLGLYRSTKEERWHDLALRAASVIMGEKEEGEDGTTYWKMAFWRVKPDFYTVDLGYFDGQAGIATVLLQMYLNETGQYHWRRLPDDPYAED